MSTKGDCGSVPPELKSGMVVEVGSHNYLYQDVGAGDEGVGILIRHEFAGRCISVYPNKVNKVYECVRSYSSHIKMSCIGEQIWQRETPEQAKIREIKETIRQLTKQVEDMESANSTILLSQSMKPHGPFPNLAIAEDERDIKGEK